MGRGASVIVRARDKLGTIERTLQRVREQSVEVELIVVDSGSTDGTLEIARRYADRVLQIPREAFSYGYALNLGASEASGAVLFALSAHCHPEGNEWVERSLALYDRPDVAATNGIGVLPDGRASTGVFYQRPEDALVNLRWGFSNHASSWRASVWRRFPFDEEIDYAEDMEWAYRVLRAGWTIAYHPDLDVDMSHRWRTSALDSFQRQRRTPRALIPVLPISRYGLRELAKEWWRDIPDDRHSRWAHRFINYRRFSGLAGKYVGHVQGRRAKAAASRAGSTATPTAARSGS